MIMGSEINGRVPYHVAVYLVDDVLIDTGSHNRRWDLVDYLADRDISMAVNTHHHLDHIGGNKLLMDRFKIPIFAPNLSVPIIARRQSVFPYQEGLWGCPEPCLVRHLSDRVSTESCIPESLMTSSGMIYRNGTAVLSRAIEYIEEMRERMRTMKEDGLSAEETVVKLFGGETPFKAFTGGQFSRENFVRSFFHVNDHQSG